jgi:hypothetical protein
MAIDGAGGSVDSLDHLEKISGFGKLLLSYHVQGSKDSKGLVELRLVDIEKGERNKISIKITTLWKTFDKQQLIIIN